MNTLIRVRFQLCLTATFLSFAMLAHEVNSQMTCQEAMKNLMDYNDKINEEYDQKKKARSADYSKCMADTPMAVTDGKAISSSEVCDGRSKRSEEEDAKWYESQMQIMEQLKKTMSDSCG